jgi:hypothetical protein
MVTVTITYDMDDEDKSLEAELNDWLSGSINVQDLGFDYCISSERYVSDTVEDASIEIKDSNEINPSKSQLENLR